MTRQNNLSRKKCSLKFLALSTAALATALSAAPSYAQSNDASYEDEIIVTARRKAENILDVPGSVTALTAATLQKAGVERVEDFIGLTPGVTLVNAAEAGDTQVNIRGINGARDAENSFAFLIDGILYTNPAAFNREYTDLRQIEVFKGPQGAIYGRNAAAGAIIVTTETPGDEVSGGVTASYAEDDSILLKGSISGPLSENVSYRVSGDYRTSDGFYRNSFQGDSPTIDASESYNLNGRLVFTPSDQLTVDVKGRYGEIDGNSIVFNANFHLPVFAAGNSIPAANQDVNEHPFVFQPNVTSDNDQTALELSGKFDYEMEGSTLTGWALYSDIENDLVADGTSAAFGFFNNDPVCQQTVADLNAQGVQLPSPEFFGTSPVGVIFDPVNGSFLGAYTPSTCDGIQEQLRNQSDISAELRLASNTDGPFSWMVGGYLLDIDRQVGVSTNRDGGGPVNRGLVQLTGENRTVALAYDDFDSSVFAVFGSADYALSDTVEASLALRYDVEKRKVSSLVPTDARQEFIDLDFSPAPDPLNAGLSPLINPNGVIPDKEETFKQLQPKFSLTWDAADNTTVYGSWGIGFKAGGFNNSGSAATVNIFNNTLIAGGTPLSSDNFFEDLNSAAPVISDDYKKEKSSAFEVGFKTSALDGRLKLAGAGYYTDVTDMQFFEFFVGGFGLLRVVSNIDEVEILGAEIGAELAATDNINLYAGANFTDSEIKANSSRTDTIGNKSPYTPDYTLNFGGDISIPVADGMDFLVRADVQLIGPTWFHTVQAGDRATIFNPLFAAGFGQPAGPLGTGNFANSRRDSYLTLDMRAGLQADKWSLMAFAQNLTNEDILEEVIPAPEFGGSFLAPGARRRFGVEAAYKF